MAKQYAIPLSLATEILTVPGSEGAEIKTRDVEKAILSSCAQVAANAEKDIRKINVAVDLLGVIENVPDDSPHVILDDADRELIDAGIKGTTGKRPTIWFRCTALWKALESWPEKKEA